MDLGDDLEKAAHEWLAHDPDPATRAEIESLLAANVPWAGLDSPLAGTAADRNVILPMAAPFPLAR